MYCHTPATEEPPPPSPPPPLSPQAPRRASAVAMSIRLADRMTALRAFDADVGGRVLPRREPGEGPSRTARAFVRSRPGPRFHPIRSLQAVPSTEART